MERETVEFYKKMEELLQEIEQKGFFRCHQSYIVNRNYVQGLSASEIVLLNKKRIPVSRRYTAHIRDIFKA